MRDGDARSTPRGSADALTSSSAWQPPAIAAALVTLVLTGMSATAKAAADPPEVVPEQAQSAIETAPPSPQPRPQPRPQPAQEAAEQLNESVNDAATTVEEATEDTGATIEDTADAIGGGASGAVDDASTGSSSGGSAEASGGTRTGDAPQASGAVREGTLQEQSFGDGVPSSGPGSTAGSTAPCPAGIDTECLLQALIADGSAQVLGSFVRRLPVTGFDLLLLLGVALAAVVLGAGALTWTARGDRTGAPHPPDRPGS